MILIFENIENKALLCSLNLVFFMFFKKKKKRTENQRHVYVFMLFLCAILLQPSGLCAILLRIVYDLSYDVGDSEIELIIIFIK